MAPDAGRPPPVGTRAVVFIAVLAAGVWAAGSLGLFSGGDSRGPGGAGFAGDFFGRALTPALHSEGPPPWGGAALLPDLLAGARDTVLFAVAALALATVVGLFLGFFGATAWWSGQTERGRFGRTVAPVVYGVTRTVIAALRSVHELLWAVLLLSALGRSEITAVVAIAIPYSGTIAKIFSEMIDEAPRQAAAALRASGATQTQVFVLGLLPQALADVTAYLFYQLECALRSAAILGFFGFPTLGYYIRNSFENLYYGEVWTFLYGLLLLILVVEWWSGAIRRRLLR